MVKFEKHTQMTHLIIFFVIHDKKESFYIKHSPNASVQLAESNVERWHDQ
jgi:hypothetical protein